MYAHLTYSELSLSPSSPVQLNSRWCRTACLSVCLPVFRLFQSIFDEDFEEVTAALLTDISTQQMKTQLNSFQNNKILGQSKLKAFANEKIHEAEKNYYYLFIFFFLGGGGMIANIVAKREQLVTSIFSFSHNVFKRLLLQGH